MRKLFRSAAVGALAAGMLASSPAGAVISVGDDPILYWNQVMFTGLPGGPPIQARSAAMTNIAMYDAVNAALGSPSSAYLSGVSATGGDVRAAASQAAHDVLVYLNPAGAATYDAALASSLALISDTSARDAGVATGSAYAAAMIIARSSDGAAGAGGVPYVPGTDPGDWQPTPPGNLAAALPGWGAVTPFVMNTGDQFRAGPPPALTSAEYAAAYNEVKDIGSATSLTRTADQSAAANFWAAAGGTSWIQIAVNLAADEGRTTQQNAQMFAQLGAGLADAFIAGFDTKYAYSFWRPVTAIRAGDTDGNDATVQDGSWSSYIVAPNHPSYLSTHSIADATAAEIILMFLDDEPFCATFGGLSRCWSGIEAASLEGAESRVWGGIHFSFDRDAGLTAGNNLAAYELGLGTFGSVPEPSTWAMMLLGFGFAGLALRRRRKGNIEQLA